MSFRHDVTFSSVSGTMVKSCADSKIVRFHKNSPLAKTMFDLEQPYRGVHHRYNHVIVLQLMLCGDDNYMVEYVDKQG